MVCIYCSGETKVTNSRLQKRANRIWRRRQCLNCGAIFTTEEQVVTEQSILVRKISAVEPFSRDKLLLSLYESLRHRKTAVSDATGLTDTIWSQLLPHIQHASVTREDIVKTAASVLKRFDKAAATSYAAFHPVKK